MIETFHTIGHHGHTFLVPYTAPFVPVYHAWMQDPALLEATASEPLTLPEEACHQAEWRDMPDRACFILIDADVCGDVDPTLLPVEAGVAAAVGDINLFWTNSAEPGEVELSVMVAVVSARRKGIARSAIQCAVVWALKHQQAHPADHFVAKIDGDNHASLALFQSLGFTEHARIEAFDEVHLRLAVADVPLADWERDMNWQAVDIAFDVGQAELQQQVAAWTASNDA